MQPPFRRLYCAAVLSLATLSVACFDAPVQYSLEILFGAEGSVEIHASTVIRDEWKDTDQRRVRDRIEATRDAIRHGEDIWSRAFRALEPDRERLVYDYKDGLLVGAIRLATAEDPSSLEKLFAVTSVTAYVERDGKTMTLDLVPPGAGAAAWFAKALGTQPRLGRLGAVPILAPHHGPLEAAFRTRRRPLPARHRLRVSR